MVDLTLASTWSLNSANDPFRSLTPVCLLLDTYILLCCIVCYMGCLFCMWIAIAVFNNRFVVYAGAGLARALSALPGGNFLFLPAAAKLAPPTPIRRFKLEGGNFVRHVVQTGSGLQKTMHRSCQYWPDAHTTLEHSLDRHTEHT